MSKQYLHGLMTSKTPPLEMIYKWRGDSAKAKPWTTKESAEQGRRMIEENCPKLGRYKCTDLQIEETDSGFVIFCDVPDEYLAEMVPSAEPW